MFWFEILYFSETQLKLIFRSELRLNGDPLLPHFGVVTQGKKNTGVPEFDTKKLPNFIMKSGKVGH